MKPKPKPKPKPKRKSQMGGSADENAADPGWSSYIPLPGLGLSTPPMDVNHPQLIATLKEDEKNLALRDWWKRTNGLETVDKWVKAYSEHPSGWGALLLIHGIPEATGRLRVKVENFAVYSALFLSTAVAMLVAPPDKIASCSGGIECEIRKRVYFYTLIVGVVSQVLCIMLAMAFGNALNEAARDADVFRMFSPSGKAFVATRKCELAYLIGVAVTFIAVLATIEVYMGWEIMIFCAIVGPVAGKIYNDAANPLITSATINGYWRSGKGGDSDPYDLKVPLHAFDTQREGILLSEALA